MNGNHWPSAFRNVSFLIFPLWDWTPCSWSVFIFFIFPSFRTCDSTLCRVGWYVCWSIGRPHFWIASLCITAPAHLSATRLPSIRPCCVSFLRACFDRRKIAFFLVKCIYSINIYLQPTRKWMKWMKQESKANIVSEWSEWFKQTEIARDRVARL